MHEKQNHTLGRTHNMHRTMPSPFYAVSPSGLITCTPLNRYYYDLPYGEG